MLQTLLRVCFQGSPAAARDTSGGMLVGVGGGRHSPFADDGRL